MPNENPPPPSLFAEIETVLHALSLYGAAGLAAFGWAMGWLLRVDAAPWFPLWFCAGLVIYNADRLHRDPTDMLNVPTRTAASERLRTASLVTLILAAGGLIGIPFCWREWLTLALVIGGAIVSLAYSFPILGFRWKDVPLVKSLIVPAIVTAAVFVPVLYLDSNEHRGAIANHFDEDTFNIYSISFGLVPWALTYLLFNMLLCDLRDLSGDAACGIRSIPVALGEMRSRHLLWVLAALCQIFLAILFRFGTPMPQAFAILSGLTGCYQFWLLRATRRPQSERFYEWAVEGLLYLPAIACGLSWLLYR